MGILKVDQWKPSTKMNSGGCRGEKLTALHSSLLLTVLLAIYDLIENPNPDDPLVTSIVSECSLRYVAEPVIEQCSVYAPNLC